MHVAKDGHANSPSPGSPKADLCVTVHDTEVKLSCIIRRTAALPKLVAMEALMEY